MSAKAILNEDWSEYDRLKTLNNNDAKEFAYTEAWERNFLRLKIQKYYPLLSTEEIDDAIIGCSQFILSPHPRQSFVECVIRRLSESGTQAIS
jgi:hypothetical protein